MTLTFIFGGLALFLLLLVGVFFLFIAFGDELAKEFETVLNRRPEPQVICTGPCPRGSEVRERDCAFPDCVSIARVAKSSVAL